LVNLIAAKETDKPLLATADVTTVDGGNIAAALR
jgi:hypothetical protein